MQLKPNFRFALAIFAALMAVMYLALGIYILASPEALKGMVADSLAKIIAVVLIAMGLLRGARAYQQFNSLR